ncbi:MAG: carboxymuconolactone decarboxylase family protein [Rhodospirillales bacterium]|jgi:uncharacterized peroxidase-related enzyme
MTRIQAIDPKNAQGQVKEQLDGVQKSLGLVPNIIATIAQSPAALESYLATGKALSGGKLDAKLREQIALAVAGENTCDYCATAHTVLGKMAGVDEIELVRNLKGESANPQIQAALKFAKTVVEKRGFVTDQELQQVRDAGYDDGEVVEIIAHVAHNIFTNYFNHIAGTEIDFPVVDTGEKAKAAA